MVKKKGGLRRKTRHKMLKPIREKGKINFTRYLQEFKDGDRVALKAEPAVQKGMYHPRFHGKLGTVKAKAGKCYEIKINDKGKDKLLIVHPVHLKRLK